MRIRLLGGQYKSISSLDWRDIPKFAVITGPNGSGKTQLLELIARSAGVIPLPPGAFNSRHHSPETFDAKVECSERLDAQNTIFLRSHWDLGDAAASITQLRAMAEEAWSRRDIPAEPSQAAARDTSWDSLWTVLEREVGQARNHFDRATFDAVLPPNFVLMKQGATHPASMYAAIPNLFLSYALRLHYLEREGGSRQDFSAKYGDPPWHAVNRVLQSAGLRYEALVPSVPRTSWTQAVDGSYRLELRNLQSGVVIAPNALSSGERVIFLTAIWSYFFNQSALATQAALLLLDEPDAHLHPALTSIFLRVVRDELVERRGMRVIATTHSPSTVALTDEGELFAMCIDEPRIRPVSNKWEAVARLTAGLVTVGTRTKAVFVEDKTDAAFFRVVQSILARGLATEVDFDVARSLNFIAASDGKAGGGKNMVIASVANIETTQVAGIVDRDEDATPEGRIYAGIRRHLESYLLDPLFIYALLLDENIAHRPDFAPGVDYRNSRSMSSLARETLQHIADGMIGIYGELLAQSSTEFVEVPYLGGIVISLPTWALQCDMKRLFEPLRQRLGVRWNQESLVRKYEVLAIVPTDLPQMLVRIQTA